MAVRGQTEGKLFVANSHWQLLDDSSLLVESGNVVVEPSGELRCAADGVALVYNLVEATYSCPTCSATALRVFTTGRF